MNVGTFADSFGGDVEFTRLAVIPVQIEEYNLPTAPAKKSDNRSFSGHTTQCEALDPKRLADITKEAIESRMDLAVYQSILRREVECRAMALERLG